MSGAEPWRQRLAELADAFALLTRLPVSSLVAVPQAAPGASVWAYPVVGATIGALGGAVYWAVYALGCPAPLAALWALAITILATGALHEDGLADSADGLAGDTPQQSLAIMRDHRIGTYGAIALLLTLGVRATAVALLAEPGAVLAALMATGAAGRAGAVMLMAALPAARNDGLSAAVGRPGGAMTGWAVGLAFGIGVLILSFGAAVAVLLSAMLASLLVGGLAREKLGGQTGDVLGAACVLGECLALTVLAALAA
jgi:adenosylcobinamide-GDP ribazoletransferase